MTRVYDGPAMTIGNMRQLGVTHLDIFCACGHQAYVDAEGIADDVEIPSLKRRYRCKCGARPNVRPDWRQHRAPGTGRS